MNTGGMPLLRFPPRRAGWQVRDEDVLPSVARGGAEDDVDVARRVRLDRLEDVVELRGAGAWRGSLDVADGPGQSLVRGGGDADAVLARIGEVEGARGGDGETSGRADALGRRGC